MKEIKYIAVQRAKNLLILMGILFCSAVNAQDSTMVKNALKHNANVDLNFRFAEGNIKQRMILFRSLYTLEGQNFSFTPTVNYSLNQIFNNQIENDLFTWGLFKYKHKKRFHPVIGGFYENAKLRSIENRFAVSVGVGVNVIQSKRAQIEINNSLAHFDTRFAIDPSRNYNGLAHHFGYSGKYQIVKDRLLFEQQVYGLFLYKDISNLSIRSFNRIVVPITKSLHILLNLEYMFEEVVDMSKQRQNILTSGGIRYQFVNN